MATDFSKVDIANDVINDIKSITQRPEFYEQVVKEAAQVHMDSAKDLTSQAQDPKGTPFRSLKPTYAAQKRSEGFSSEPDLRYQNKSMESMYITEGAQNREANIRFAKGGGYMYEHQRGLNRKPQRKVFAEQQEVSSPPQTQNHKKVEHILSKYLNQQRTVKVG